MNDHGRPGTIVWITGLPSSGKSTLGERLHAALTELGCPSCLLDGDRVRAALVPAPGYDENGRDGFYRTLAGFAALLARQGLVTIVAATAHARRFREHARSLAPKFIEVFVDVPPKVCARRDAKGLYRRAARGEASNVPGADVSYERPDAPEVVARGGLDEDAIRAIVTLIGPAFSSRGELLASSFHDIAPREEPMSSQTISAFMTPSPHSIGSDQKLAQAHRMMRSLRIRHLPVLEGGKLVGMLSDRDLYWMETLKDVDENEVLVEEAMTPLPYCVAPDAPLADVAREMATRKYGAAVVMQAGEIVGVFTTTDALHALASVLNERNPARPPASTPRALKAAAGGGRGGRS